MPAATVYVPSLDLLIVLRRVGGQDGVDVSGNMRECPSTTVGA